MCSFSANPTLRQCSGSTSTTITDRARPRRRRRITRSHGRSPHSLKDRWSSSYRLEAFIVATLIWRSDGSIIGSIIGPVARRTRVRRESLVARAKLQKTALGANANRLFHKGRLQNELSLREQAELTCFRPRRRHSGLLGGTGLLARLPSQPERRLGRWSTGAVADGVRCAPTDRSRPRRSTHCLRRSSASSASIRIPCTSAR
jgi:hypothetical protein